MDSISKQNNNIDIDSLISKCANQNIEITDDVRGIVNLLANREWRLDNLYWIFDKRGKLIKFKMNESQRLFWASMWYVNLILKDRQRGFSTFIALLMFDTCFFCSGTQAGIVDITLSDAKKKLAKVRVAYENLPDWLKELNPLVTDSKLELAWANGSAVYASTSHRGGTLQFLHISERGKIAARFPERAREIRTGALNTIQPGCIICDESTAEGNAGEFYEDCQEAISFKDQKRKLTKVRAKFHFFGWWMGTDNEIDPDGVYVPREVEQYCDNLERELGIEINDRKRAWYAEKSIQQKDDMTREFPSTPEEAFAAAVEGAYLSKQLQRIDKSNRIKEEIPPVNGIPINTGWDFGINDTMVIWFHQRVSGTDRIIGYMAGSDEDLLYYWAEMNKRYAGHVWGNHFVPHDFGSRRAGTAATGDDSPRTLKDILVEAGANHVHVISRLDSKMVGIAETRSYLPQMYFSKKDCSEGIKALRNFKRKWDEVNGRWMDKPHHDWAMHPYDAMETLVRGLNSFGVRPVLSGGNDSGEMEKPQRTSRRRLNWRAC